MTKRAFAIVAVAALALGASLPSAATTQIHPKAAVQAGWTPIAVSARGVVVDRRFVSVGGATFTLARFRANSVAFHWHAGYLDPPGASRLPSDAGSRIAFNTEGVVGVIGAFNGGFKAGAGGGGVVTDGVTLEAMRPGLMTVAIDVHGLMRIGVWGRDLPSRSFGAVTYRQNLGPLVDHSVIASSALTGRWPLWGFTIGHAPNVARTGLGVDASGNVIYAATMTPVSPYQLAKALTTAGATEALELDINPDWPILGLAAKPIHRIAVGFGFSLPQSRHDPAIYEAGWQRDFFTVLQEPDSWSCSIATPGLRPGGVPQAQNVGLVGSNCPRP